MKVAFYTLGCKVNHYETQAMTALFAEAGDTLVAFDQAADVYIVNTCTVTQVSDKKSRQMLARARRLSPTAAVIAVGCLGQTDAKSLEALGIVDLVLGTSGRKEIVAQARALAEQQLPLADGNKHGASEDGRGASAHSAFEELSAVHDSRTRATLKIQDGCANYCAYCIIPFARGNPRSRNMESCERELRALALAGYREVVLTGIQLASYGRDLPKQPDLCDVIALAAQIPGLDRVRLGSLAPTFVTERFVQTCKASRNLCGQFHLSLQSGSDTVLARMNRRYTTADYRKAVELLREILPNCAVTTDVIAGFPGESPEEHAQTCAFVRELGFARLHVFPYSLRPGTAAASMTGHLPKSVKEQRARELIAIGESLQENFVQAQLGKTASVLIEEQGCGYTENYVRVRVDGEPLPEGIIVEGTLTAREGSTAILHINNE